MSYDLFFPIFAIYPAFRCDFDRNSSAPRCRLPFRQRFAVFSRIFPDSTIFRIPEIHGFYGNSFKLGQIHRYLAKYDGFQRNADLLRKVENPDDLLRKVENQRNAEISGEMDTKFLSYFKFAEIFPAVLSKFADVFELSQFFSDST